MASTVVKPSSYGTSPGRDRVVRGYRQLVGSASDEAAHQRMRKVEREFLALVVHFARTGATARIVRLRARIDEASLVAPACTTDACLLEETRAVHRADQGEDTARFDLPVDLTPAAEEKLLRATYQEIAAKERLATLLEARKAGRCTS